MSVLTIYKDDVKTLNENTTGTIDYEIGDNQRLAPPPLIVKDIILVKKIRSVKVLRIRQQLADGTYELDDKFDAILEDLLNDIDL